MAIAINIFNYVDTYKLLFKVAGTRTSRDFPIRRVIYNYFAVSHNSNV